MKMLKNVVNVKKSLVHLEENIIVESKLNRYIYSYKIFLIFSCGQIFCETCASAKLSLPSSNKPVRVCDMCRNHLLAQCAVNSS